MKYIRVTDVSDHLGPSSEHNTMFFSFSQAEGMIRVVGDGVGLLIFCPIET